MHLGHSGATIEVFEDYVIKTGYDLAAQAKYCADHPEAFVRTDAFWPTVPEKYRMERLMPAVGRWTDIAAGAIALARAHLWKPIPDRECEGTVDIQWARELKIWAEESHMPWLNWKLICGIYPEAPIYDIDRFEFIHGDMTIANIMQRGNRLVFIDPRPATGKVPPLREVDYGKLMQSALGWELLLLGQEPQRDEAMIDLVYREAYKDGISPKQVEFWTAVNLARILPYAKNENVMRWAKSHSERIANDLSARL